MPRLRPLRLPLRLRRRSPSKQQISNRDTNMAYDSHVATDLDHDGHDHKPQGWRRWVYATNHKDIGTMYLVFAGISFFIGGSMAMLIRLELFKPGMQFLD